VLPLSISGILSFPLSHPLAVTVFFLIFKSLPSTDCFRGQFLCKMWPIQLTFLLLLFVGYSLPTKFFAILHFSHDRSKVLSPSFSSTTFQSFPSFFNLLFEVSTFHNQTLKCYKCSILLVYSLNMSPILLVKRAYWLNVTFSIANLDLISLVHLASLVITYFKLFLIYSNQYRVWSHRGLDYLSFLTFISIPLHLPISILIRVRTIKFANSPPRACHGSTGQKP
jgi:hypothetical protein